MLTNHVCVSIVSCLNHFVQNLLIHNMSTKFHWPSKLPSRHSFAEAGAAHVVIGLPEQQRYLQSKWRTGSVGRKGKAVKPEFLTAQLLAGQEEEH